MSVDNSEAALFPKLHFWSYESWLNNCLMTYSCEVVGNVQYGTCDLLFALSFVYDKLVYQIQHMVMLEKDNFHHLICE